MNLDENVLTEQFHIVEDFVRHLAYSNAIDAELKLRDRSSAFWPQTSNAHLEAATLDWCKVFGADGNNPTHWKYTPLRDKAKFQDEFRRRLFSKTGFDKVSWEAYWEKVCGFRDQYVAHRDLNVGLMLPQFEPARQIAYAYDEWVRALYLPKEIPRESFDKRYPKWMADAKSIMVAAPGTPVRV